MLCRDEIIVVLQLNASDVEEAKSLISGTEAQIYERLSKFIYGVDDASLAEYLGQELLKSGSIDCLCGILHRRFSQQHDH